MPLSLLCSQVHLVKSDTQMLQSSSAGFAGVSLSLGHQRELMGIRFKPDLFLTFNVSEHQQETSVFRPSL